VSSLVYVVRVLRKIFIPKSKKVTRLRNLHKEELRKVYYSSDVIILLDLIKEDGMEACGRDGKCIQAFGRNT
jgi:hypothetical protein